MSDQPMISLEAKISGNDKIRAAMMAFPTTMHDQYVKWLYSVRKSYIGTRTGKMGKFRRDLARLKRGAGAPSEFARSGNWPKNVTNAFKGSVNRGSTDWSTSRLAMGTGYGNNPFLSGLYGMDVSTAQMNVKSGSNMVFPVYKNLRKRGRLVGPMHVNRKNQALKETLDNDQTFSIKRGSATLIFDAMDRNKRGPNAGKLRRSALLFVLKREFKMPKKFDYINQFNTLKPMYINRADGMLKRAVRAIEKGYLKAA